MRVSSSFPLQICPSKVENLAQEVLCLAREILVLRETLDEIREYLQWINHPKHGPVSNRGPGTSFTEGWWLSEAGDTEARTE